jgi:hypothetical protein
MVAHMIARIAVTIGIAFCTFGYSACVFKSGGDPDIGSGDDGGVIDDATFSTTLILRDASGIATTSFVMGEPIRFDLEVLNRTSRTVSLQFADGQIYDFYVFAANSNQVLWRWAADKAFPQVATELTFLPNSSKAWLVGWDAVLADGTQLPVGSYRARGVIVSSDYRGDPLASGELASPLVNFTVR